MIKYKLMRRQHLFITTFTLVFASVFQSCENKQATVSGTEAKPATQLEKKAALNEFQSSLRPGEKLKLQTNYTDTVKFIGFDDNGDNELFIAAKNRDTISLIYDKGRPKFIKGDRTIIHWIMDSIRNAGDPEYVDYREFLLTARKISGAASGNEFSQMKNRSIVISCGTGCAMTYSPREIKQINPTAISVTFDVETHMDEEAGGIFSETYIFHQDHTLELIRADGMAENFTKNISESALWSFQEFGKELLKQIK